MFVKTRKTSYSIVVGAIVEKNGRILLVKEAKPKAYGLWNIPAGLLEINESPIEGAKREVKEETGLDIEINGIVGIYIGNPPDDPNKINIKIVFRSKVTGGSIKTPTKELLDIKWFEPSEALAIKDSQLRSIRKEIEDFVKNRNYPLDIIEI